MQHVIDNSKDPCAGFLANLDLWLASELDAGQDRVMQAHHDTCPACQLETRLARQITAITAALPAQVCPELQFPLIKQTDSSAKILPQQTTRRVALPRHSYIARLLHTWRQPFVYVPAFALVLVMLLVIQLRDFDTVVDPELVIIDGREYTREEIVRATADLELALQYLDKYASYPAKVVQAELEESRLPLPPPQDRQDIPSI
jgi:hypothetical protein